MSSELKKLYFECKIDGGREFFAKIAWLNVIEFLAAIYYIGLVTIGFRNIYVIFIKQKKYSSLIFPLMYLFAQILCILQITQCFMFFSLNIKFM